MKKEFNMAEIICDECGLQKQSPTGMVGASPFSGWFELKLLGGTTAVWDIERRKTYHFCSKECLVSWVNDPPERPNKPA